VYLVYLAQGQSVQLNVAPGRYEIVWLNPRTGAATGLPNVAGTANDDEPTPSKANAEPINVVEMGAPQTINTDTGKLTLTPPANDGKDWAALIRVWE